MFRLQFRVATLQQPLLQGLRDALELFTEALSTLVYPGFTRGSESSLSILPNWMNTLFYIQCFRNPEGPLMIHYSEPLTF